MYEGFVLVEAPSLLGREDLGEDIRPGFGASETVRLWQPVYLKDVWIPPKVEGRVSPVNDFPGISIGLPAFSERACNELRDLLEPSGELLPLDTEVGNYYFYNITKVVDALDLANSICDFWCDPPTTAVDIEYYSFKANLLDDVSIFRIYENPIATLVTNEFVSRVQKTGLSGFSFSKLWPLPQGVNWRLYNKENKDPEVDLKAQTVVMIFFLDKKDPSNKERSLLSKIEDELDKILLITSKDMPYYGSYEGHDIVGNEYRMFLSCPSADALVAKLISWLEVINKSIKCIVVKRYGSMRDQDAKEQLVEV